MGLGSCHDLNRKGAVMQSLKTTARFTAPLCLIALAACGGGGGGGSATPATNVSSTPASAAATPPASAGDSAGSSSAVSIGAAGAASLNGNTPTLAAGVYTPQAGTVFALNQSVLKVTTTSVTDATSSVGGATVTYRSASALGAAKQQLELKIPGLGIDVANLQGVVSFSGDGGGINALLFPALHYTALAVWNQSLPGGTTYYSGVGVTGYQTPTASVPMTGTATYLGSNAAGLNQASGMTGIVFAPKGDGTVASTNIFGDASIGVNFASGAVTGTISNTKTVAGGTDAAWNNVNLNGNLSGATLSGITSTTAVSGGGTFTFSGSATGTFNGALYGPNGEELGAVWSLADRTNNKSALGAIGAAK